jgi:hypothetical protein
METPACQEQRGRLISWKPPDAFGTSAIVFTLPACKVTVLPGMTVVATGIATIGPPDVKHSAAPWCDVKRISRAWHIEFCDEATAQAIKYDECIT